MRICIIATVLVATLIQCCKPQQTGTNWFAGETLKVMDGRYQIVAGPTWPSNERRDKGYTFYRISIEAASCSSWRTIYQKDIPFSDLPKEFANRHAPEVAKFNKASSTIHFDLGPRHQIEYKIEAEQDTASDGDKPRS